MQLSGEQIRAARALARLGQADLAQRSGLSLETVKRLEAIRGPVSANARTLAQLEQAFRTLGVVFDGHGGLGRIRPHEGGPVARARYSTEQELHRLTYHSVMASHCAGDPSVHLSDILAVSLRNNASERLTGALLAASGRFLQVLEGVEPAIEAAYERIKRDPRHDGLQIVERRRVSRRHFPDWNLCCGELYQDEAVIAAEPALHDGFHPEHLSPSAALGLLGVVRDLAVESSRLAPD